MNSVVLIGRLTRDPELRYTASTQMAVASFSIAVDRPTRSGGDRQTDFPRITVFGKQAENCEKYLAKGRLVAIQGRLQTGSYQNKNGDTVYTTDVVADRVQFLEWGDKPQGNQGGYQGTGDFGQPNMASSSAEPDFGHSASVNDEMPSSFEAIEDDLPF